LLKCGCAVLKVSIPPKDTIGVGDFIMPLVSGDENRTEVVVAGKMRRETEVVGMN
jgi:hypothetical protein